MRWRIVFSLLIGIVAGGVQRSASAALTIPNTAPSAQFGHFTSYSLKLLEFVFGGTFVEQSSPGQIAGDVVIGTGSSGGGVTENFAGMNDAYATPSGNTEFFSTGIVAHPPTTPGSPPVPDPVNSWNATVASLRTFLAAGGGDFVIFFDLNETGSPVPDQATVNDRQENRLGASDLLAWGKVTLSGAMVADKVFFVSAADDPATGANELAAGLAASAMSGAPNPDTVSAGTHFPTLDAQWATAHARITVNPDGTLRHFGPKSAVYGDTNANSVEIDQNLGNNLAEFAIFNRELSDLIKDPSSPYTQFKFEYEFSRVNNGAEQVFVKNNSVVQRIAVVPEPSSSLAWCMLALTGIGYRKLRRNRSASRS